VTPTIRFIFKWSLLIALTAILSGVSAALFLAALKWVTQYRGNNLWLFFTLPLSGLLIVFAYQRFGENSEQGNNLIFKEISEPKKTLPIYMSPLVLLGTLLTHLSGGSAGREGTAVQMGASLADLFGQKFQLSAFERRKLLMMGMAGGFAAVFGTPLAGALFASEVLQQKNRSISDAVLLFLTAQAAHFICHLTTVSHTDYHFSATISFSADMLFNLFISAVAFGFAARLFVFCAEFFSEQSKKWLPSPYYRVLFGGSVLAFFFIYTKQYHLAGLGIPTIQQAFESPVGNFDFLAKIVLTTFTLSMGFKGGEVTPLFFIGATLANVLSLFLPISLPILVACGFLSVFAAATKTPTASAIMGGELFGWTYLPLFLITGFISYYVSGKKGIYKIPESPENLESKWGW
jgi:H+/Cl- antiporter ClcA